MKNSTPYHPTVTRIIDFLKENNCTFRAFEHEPVRTSEEAARIRPEYSLKEGAKALIVRIKRKQTVGGTKEQKGVTEYAQIVVPGDRRFDPKKARRVLGAKDIRFATVAEVSDITGGVEPGGVPPFGNLFGIPVYADSGIFENEEMVFNAGDRRYSIAMCAKDYREVVTPHIACLATE